MKDFKLPPLPQGEELRKLRKEAKARSKNVRPQRPWAETVKLHRTLAGYDDAKLRMPKEPMSRKGPACERYTLDRFMHLKEMKKCSPRALDLRLQDAGGQGPKQARRALCLAAYRHLKRARRIFVEREFPANLAPKSNLVLAGLKAQEQTKLLSLLFGEVLGLPSVVYDVRGLLRDAERAGPLDRLVEAAGGNYKMAELGVICLDKLDMLALSEADPLGVLPLLQRSLAGFISGSRRWVQLSDEVVDRRFRPLVNSRDILFVANKGLLGMAKSFEAYRREFAEEGYALSFRDDAMLKRAKEGGLGDRKWMDKMGQALEAAAYVLFGIKDAGDEVGRIEVDALIRSFEG